MRIAMTAKQLEDIALYGSECEAEMHQTLGTTLRLPYAPLSLALRWDYHELPCRKRERFRV
jgi:hypothetical protein